MSPASGTRRRAVVALAIRVASAGLAYGSQILLARWLGLEQYGTFVAIWVWLLVLGGTAPLGLNVTVIGLLPGYLEQDQHARWRGLTATAMAVALGVATAMAMAGAALLALVPSLVADVYMVPLWLGFVCLPLIALGDVNEGVARAHGWMAAALVPAYVLRPLLMLLAAGGLVALGYDLDTAAIMGCALAASMLTSLPQASVLLARMRRFVPGRERSFAMGAWILGGLPVVAMEACELLLQNLDILIVAALLGSMEAGLYFAAQKTIGLVAFVNFAVGAATASQVAAVAARGDRAALEAEVRGAVTLAFWPSLAAALIVLLASPTLLGLFGAGFDAALALMPVLAVGLIARALVGPAELFLVVLGEQKALALMLPAALALGVALNLVLVPAFEAMGAAMAMALTLVALSAGYHLIARRRLGIVLLPRLRLPSSLATST